MPERAPAPALSPRRIEQRAERLLAACESAGGVAPPVPAEWIAEHVLDLAIVWDALATAPNAPVLGALDAARGELILNERERRRFEAFPGLEAFTLAHEIGHWLLHVPPTRRRQFALPGIGPRAGRTCAAGLGAAARREQEADQFAARLLMPARLLLPRCADLDLSRFPARYRLRDEFGVSITAMNLRLKELGFGWFDEQDQFVESKGRRRRTAGTIRGKEPLTRSA